MDGEPAGHRVSALGFLLVCHIAIKHRVKMGVFEHIRLHLTHFTHHRVKTIVQSCCCIGYKVSKQANCLAHQQPHWYSFLAPKKNYFGYILDLMWLHLDRLQIHVLHPPFSSAQQHRQRTLERVVSATVYRSIGAGNILPSSQNSDPTSFGKRPQCLYKMVRDGS